MSGTGRGGLMLALTPEETTQKAGKHACPLAAHPLKPSILQYRPSIQLASLGGPSFRPLKLRLAPLTTDDPRLDFAYLT